MHDTPRPARARRTPLSQIVIPCLLAAGLAAAYFGYVWYTQPVPQPVDVSLSLRELARQIQRDQTLNSAYTDADGDKLADPPTDASQWQNPDELGFCFIAADDPDDAEKAWKPLMESIAAKTGKRVKYLRDAPLPAKIDDPIAPTTTDLRTMEEQLRGLKDRRLHITAFTTGAVPIAVTTAGFHPLFVPVNVEGKVDYQMQIIVPANSPIKDPAGLKGQTIGFVAMSSNSGGRAPLVLLREKFDMLPGRDYQFVMTGNHERSIRELVAGTAKYQAASVASDIFEQLKAKQEFDESRIKVIYTSSSFPKVAFGVPHNLHPDLRRKIAEAFAEFKTPKPRFAAIVYAKAFADVLSINGKLAEAFGGNTEGK